MPKKVDYSSLNALIAMSNKQLGRTVWHFLRDSGVRAIKVVTTAEDATSRMLASNFSLIVVDHDLPEMGGVDFIRFLRMCEGPLSEAFAVMVVPAPSQEKVMAARDAGVHEILGLPLTTSLLNRRLSHMLEKPKPFIRHPSYTGPCRRREVVKIYHGIERRTKSSGPNQTDRIERFSNGEEI